ncbi:p53 and DNA damage-regulated protein 1-like [Babylonia areolata]|uniref:p53 and DNA damage-regulated protein 1-like n=1 Tax=Babylonia areolata TaxID=304850 RepID=UPI003FD52950
MAEEAAVAPVNSQQLLEHLTHIEGAAEDILADKHKLVDLDRHRNQTREAMRILQKGKTDKKQWMCLGNMFIKMEKKSASRFLEKDFDHTSQEIGRTRTELKPKMNHLRDLEHKEELKGFNLNPLSKDEVTAINDLL